MVLEYPRQADWKWNRTIVANAGAYSDPLIIPGFVEKLVAQLIPGVGGSCTLWYTAAPPDEVDANPSAVSWVEWAAGAVTETTAQTAIGAISALRIFATGVAASAHIVGEKRVDWR